LLGIVSQAALTEFASGSAGTVVVITGALAGCTRAWAVLRKFSADRIEYATAGGFAVGAVATILLVFIDIALKWS